jgi:hypothetical protein
VNPCCLAVGDDGGGEGNSGRPAARGEVGGEGSHRKQILVMEARGGKICEGGDLIYFISTNL